MIRTHQLIAFTWVKQGIDWNDASMPLHNPAGCEQSLQSANSELQMNKLLGVIFVFSSIASSALADNQQDVCNMLKNELTATIAHYLVISSIAKRNSDEDLRERSRNILDNSDHLKTSVDLAKVYETLCKN